MRAEPDRAALYAALCARDASYDGLFVYGVETTGVFCRPTCRSRPPRPENVAYFDDAAAARRAGYRACRRCRPLEVAGASPPWLEPLAKRARERPNERIPDAALLEAGIEPRTARRWFLARHGMTFQAYQRAHRLGDALAALSKGDGVVPTALSHGYDSTSGFASALSRATGRSPGRARGIVPVSARWLSTPLGRMLAVATEKGLARLAYGDGPTAEREVAALVGADGAPVLAAKNEVLDRVEDQLARWFAGTLTKVDVPLDLRGTPFQRAVWDRLTRIPYGTTASYGDVARDVGRPGAVRAVGTANGANPVAIVVPCHRVVRSDGTLGGYGGGLWRKQRLLDLERQVLALSA